LVGAVISAWGVYIAVLILAVVVHSVCSRELHTIFLFYATGALVATQGIAILLTSATIASAIAQSLQ
jgi:hypothetical protein